MENRIKVAVIDTGIDLKHDFFKNSIYDGYGVEWRDGEIIYNRNFSDNNGHGTACASIILNECKNVEFTIIKAMNENGTSNLSIIEHVLRSLINSDVSIINMSFAISENTDSDLYDICTELVKKKKILICSLDNNKNISYPAYFDNVIGVKGFVLESRDTMWFDKSKEIQCVIDNNPFMCCSVNNTYKMMPQSNSFAAARLTGVICRLLSSGKNISIDSIDFNTVCNNLENNALRTNWLESDLKCRKRCPVKEDWYIDNSDLLLNRIYKLVKEEFKVVDGKENICDCELLTLDGIITLDESYKFVEHIINELKVDINYMDISKYDLLTVGTVTKFFEEYM